MNKNKIKHDIKNLDMQTSAYTPDKKMTKEEFRQWYNKPVKLNRRDEIFLRATR